MPEFRFYLDAVLWCNHNERSHAFIVKNGHKWQVPDSERNPLAGSWPPAIGPAQRDQDARYLAEKKDGPVTDV